MEEMKSVPRWTAAPEAADPAYWERFFPGHGAAIAELAGSLVDWEPALAPSGETVRADIIVGSAWSGVVAVETFAYRDMKDALARARSRIPLERALKERLSERFPDSSWEDVRLAMNGVFSIARASVAEQEGALIHELLGPRFPDTSAWIGASGLVMLGVAACISRQSVAFEGIKLLLRCWRNGGCLLWLGEGEAGRTAYVLTGDPPRVPPVQRKFWIERLDPPKRA